MLKISKTPHLNVTLITGPNPQIQSRFTTFLNAFYPIHLGTEIEHIIMDFKRVLCGIGCKTEFSTLFRL